MVTTQRNAASNATIAKLLSEIADLLQQQGAGEYRVQAYRRAAETLQDLPESVEAIYRRDGLHGLIAIPTVGRAIAAAISQYVHSHRIDLLDRLRGDELVGHAVDPRKVQLRFWDDRMDHGTIPIAELLDVDQEYRDAASHDQLRLDVSSHSPMMSVQRGDRHYTVHYSHSPRAQQFHATEDWVVIERDDQPEHMKWTVMTSHDGRLHGCRTVRGRDEECYDYYRAAAKKAVEMYPMAWEHP